MAGSAPTRRPPGAESIRVGKADRLPAMAMPVSTNRTPPTAMPADNDAAKPAQRAAIPEVANP